MHIWIMVHTVTLLHDNKGTNWVHLKCDISYDFRHIETKYEAHYRREYILFQEKVIEFFVGRTAHIARYLIHRM